MNTAITDSGAPSRGAVVITGASTGIARACALALDALGFQVFAGVRKAEDSESLRHQGTPEAAGPAWREHGYIFPTRLGTPEWGDNVLKRSLK